MHRELPPRPSLYICDSRRQRGIEIRFSAEQTPAERGRRAMIDNHVNHDGHQYDDANQVIKRSRHRWHFVTVDRRGGITLMYCPIRSTCAKLNRSAVVHELDARGGDDADLRIRMREMPS